jgi:hypothetical protein
MKIKDNIQIATGAVLFTTFVAVPFTAHAKAEVKLSGQISQAITFADNGTDDDVLFVDNNNSGTRFRLTGKMDVSPGLTAGVVWETQYQDNSSSTIDIGSKDDSTTNELTSRKRDLWFKGGWGKLSLGKGDGAANGTSEVDFSGTSYIAEYSGNNLDDGISFADSAGNKLVKNGAAFSNFDGLSRNNRLRYDTPAYGPIGVAVSAGQDKAELGLRYQQKLGGGSKVGAALGYVGADNPGSANFKQLGLSASYLAASGFNVTGHYGERDTDGSAVDPEGTYIKIGQKMGLHAVSLAYHKVDDLAAAGDEAERVNLAYVYNIAKGVELFGFYQNSSLDRTFGPSIEDVDQFSIGSRIKF